MTAPSRRPEIKQRRKRKEKITLLRRRYATAKTDADRTKIVEKVRRLYPGRAPEEMLTLAK